jgi:hypothetical protein
MYDAKRQGIMYEARETLARLKREDLARGLNMPLLDPVETWKTKADARTAARAAAREELAAMKQQQPELDWAAFDQRVQSMIEARLEQHSRMLAEAFGDAAAELLDEQHKNTMQKTRDELRAHRDEVRELKFEIAKLGSECAELRALLATERSNRTAASTR